MINKMENDQAQKSAGRNTSDFAKKVYAAFNDCVARCEGPDCVNECKVEWGMDQ
jgi:hypothetical protein